MITETECIGLCLPKPNTLTISGLNEKDQKVFALWLLKQHIQTRENFNSLCILSAVSPSDVPGESLEIHAPGKAPIIETDCELPSQPIYKLEIPTNED